MQKKNTTYRILALVLAALMFFVSSNLSVDLHFCQGKLKSFSFFGKAPNCHEMAKSNSSCPFHQQTEKEGCGEEDKDCCQNKLLYLQSDINEYLQPTKLLDAEQDKRISVASYTPPASIQFLANKYYPQHKAYKPPLISENIPVLYQSFLL